jgi:hypothetical protein
VQEQLRDVMFALDTQTRVSAGAADVREELQVGTNELQVGTNVRAL